MQEDGTAKGRRNSETGGPGTSRQGRRVPSGPTHVKRGDAYCRGRFIFGGSLWARPFPFRQARYARWHAVGKRDVEGRRESAGNRRSADTRSRARPIGTTGPPNGSGDAERPLYFLRDKHPQAGGVIASSEFTRLRREFVRGGSSGHRRARKYHPRLSGDVVVRVVVDGKGPMAFD